MRWGNKRKVVVNREGAGGVETLFLVGLSGTWRVYLGGATSFSETWKESSSHWCGAAIYGRLASYPLLNLGKRSEHPPRSKALADDLQAVRHIWRGTGMWHDHNQFSTTLESHQPPSSVLSLSKQTSTSFPIV